MKSINPIPRHDSFLEMKVIIQLSGLKRRLEDTDQGQKPVQLLSRPYLQMAESQVQAKKIPCEHGIFQGGQAVST
ncbi:hypothetical protein [Pseudomonas sp. S2_C03]